MKFPWLISQYGRWALCSVFMGLGACGTPPPPTSLPPSASDLTLLGKGQLCQSQSQLHAVLQGPQLSHTSWGTGLVIQKPAYSGQPDHDRFYFFDEDHKLIGAVFRYSHGLNLAPYPVLRQTLAQLPPPLEFFMDTAPLLRGGDIETAKLYRTGDKTSTTRYVALKEKQKMLLLLATVVVDPYEPLLGKLQKKFLERREREGISGGHMQENLQQQEDFFALQQFARGETAWFSSCGKQYPDIAQDGYQRALQRGFSEKSPLTAEVHHKLGLVLKETGEVEGAYKELTRALDLSPHNPTYLNSLGTVLAQRGDHREAMKAFAQAIVLKPNYARARFNVAQALEGENRRRAIEEYKTFLVLVEGIPEEMARAALARERVLHLKRR